MMSIHDYLQDAMKVGATELWLSSGNRPKIRTVRDWKFLDSSNLKAGWVRDQVMQSLQEDEKAVLNDQQCLTLSFSHGTVLCQMVVSLSEDGYQIHLRWGQEKGRHVDFGVPQAVLEVLRKGQGLTFVVGTRGSGKTTLVAELLHSLSQKQITSIAYFSDIKGGKVDGATEYNADILLKNLSVSYGLIWLLSTLSNPWCGAKPFSWRSSVFAFC
jgi:twitching motility protein PilT